MTAEVRRGIVLAVAGLLGGFAMVVALFGTGELLKRNAAGGPSSETPSEAAKPPGGDGAGTPPSGAPLAALPTPPQGGSAAPAPGGGGPGDRNASDKGPDKGPANDADKAAGSGAPTFDIVRVERDGASVVAGRAAPNARVELLRDGRPFASTVADAAGQFALTPPDLPPGSSEIALSAVGPDGKPLRGRESVTVVVAEKRDAKPLIALSAPDAPTRVLSQPDAPETPAGKPATAFAEIPGKAAPDAKGGPAANEAAKNGTAKGPATQGEAAPGTPPASREAAARPEAAAKDNPAKDNPAKPAREAVPPRIVSVDAQDGGRLDVTAQAGAGSTLRLYLNDTLVASGRTGPDERIAFTIGRGVRSGAYQIRIDAVDPAGGKVRGRAEVAFAYPESAARIASAEKPAEKPGTDAAGARGAAAPAAGPAPARPAARPAAETPPASARPGQGQGAGQGAGQAGTPTKPESKQAAAPAARPVPDARPPAPGGPTQPGSSESRPVEGKGADGKGTDDKGAESRTADAKPAERAAEKPAEKAPEAKPAPSLAAAPPKPAVPERGASTAGTPSVAAAAGPSAPTPGKDGPADDRAARALSPVLPGAAEPPAAASSPAWVDAARKAAEAGPGLPAAPPEDRAGAVFVPEVSTARITRGDSLWQISRRTYGKGNRYTVIYDANQDQIRDPDLIYPGQIFVLPKDAPAADGTAPNKRT